MSEICEECGGRICEHSERIIASGEIGKLVGKMNDTIRHLEAQNRRYREALEEISLGKGAYSQDQFEHCQNTVRDMKELAQSALKTDE